MEAPDVTGVFRPLKVKSEAEVSKKSLIEAAVQYRASLAHRIPTVEESEAMLQACAKDELAGFAGPLVTEEAMRRRFPAGWAPVERFNLQQFSAAGTVKNRPIDNAKRSGHNDTADAVEKLDLCSAVQPVLHVQALFAALQKRQVSNEELAGLQVESGGEDLPDAYRYVPVSAEDAGVNIIAVYDHRVQQWRYQEVFGNLFGMAAAVLNFNRWPRFLTAAIRRLMGGLLVFSFDDASMQDLNSGKGR